MKQITNNYFTGLHQEDYRNDILSYCQEDYQILKNSVHRMMENRFLFDGTWDMEPCPTEHYINPMKWAITFDNDPEWAYMLNRQEYLINFIITYLVEGKMDYIHKLKFFLFDWIKQNPTFSPQSLTTRRLDTGIRCFTWLKIVLLLSELQLLNDQELAYICQSITKQLSFLKQHYLPKYTLSNWGILQTIPMIACYYFLGNYLNIEDEYQFAVKELEQQVQIQILEDGTQFEQSILYHVEVYKALLELCLFIPDMKKKYTKILEKMAFYICMMTGMDGYTIALGDSDCTSTDAILALSAIVLDKEFAGYSHHHLDCYSLLLLRKKEFKKLISFNSNSETYPAHFFKDSGHICIKQPDSYFFFKNGPVGSAHSHSDQNSFCLHHKGKPIFVDGGRYTYRNSTERFLLKSSWGHSSCIIDRTPPEKIKSSWEYTRYPQSLYCNYQENDGHFYIEGAYLGQVGSLTYLHQRYILILTEGVWLIVDDIKASGHHELLTQFLLDNQVEFHHHQIENLIIFSDSPLHTEETILSKRYNEIERTHKLVKTQHFSDRIIDYTLLADSSFNIKRHTVYQTDGNVLKNALAFECQNHTSNKLIFLSPDDIYQGEKLCIVNSIKMRGKCLIYDQKNTKRYRLKS